MKTKSQSLEDIADKIAHCRICKKGKSGMPVPGEGNPDADIVFIGEAPGRTEAATGRPFIGRSGQLLRRFICEVGLSEEEVFITSPVKYLPDRGTPTKEDIRHGREHLTQQLDVIRPKILVLLGKTAVYALLDTDMPVMKVHGTVHLREGRHYMVTIHPAAVLRFPKYKPIMLDDFRKLRILI